MTQIDRLYGLVGNTAIKAPIRVATTGPITLSGEQTIDGIAVVSGDRVLVKDQADAKENGIYNADTGDWDRAADFDGNLDITTGTLMIVNYGTVNANSYWRVSSVSPITINTSNIDLEPAIISDSATVNFIQGGTGAVARTAQAKMREVFSVMDFGAVGDGVTDDTAAIQAAIDAAGDKEVVFPTLGTTAVYAITDELVLSSSNAWQRWRALGGRVVIKWIGAVNSAKSMVRVTASVTNSIAGFGMENISLQADAKAGYCLILEGENPPTGQVGNSIFKGCHFGTATVIATLIGTIETSLPPGIDADASHIYFEMCQWYNSPICVQINASNAYTITFNKPIFGENGGYSVSGVVNQYVRILIAGQINLNAPEFNRMGKTAADIYCIYSEAGGVSIRDVYMEESRLLYCDSNAHSFNNHVLVENVYVNDGNTPVTTDAYAIYNVNMYLTVRNATFRPIGDYKRHIYSAGRIDVSNVDLGVASLILDPTSTNTALSIIDGRVVGATQALNANYNFSQWDRINGAGVDDNCQAWAKSVGTSGVAVVKRSTDYEQIGAYTAHVDCTTASTTFLSGVIATCEATVGETGWVTAIMFGRVSDTASVTPSLSINGGTGHVGGMTSTFFDIGGDANYFVASREANLSGLAPTTFTIRGGISANQTGEMWIGSIVVIPGKFSNGLANGMYRASPRNLGRVDTSTSTQIGAAGTGGGVNTIGALYPSANASGYQRFLNSNSQVNWQWSTQHVTNGFMELTPSSAVGGSTFTTPVVGWNATNYRPGTDNTVNLGTASLKWKEVFSNNGTINTSDARKKSPVRTMTEQEVAAAKALAAEVGVFQFLDAIQQKGDAARHHIGLTVQRAIEVMVAHGLDPFGYGFVCYDQWEREVYERIEVKEPGTDIILVEAATFDRPGGDSFGFRTDQLMLFIARGMDERLKKIESALKLQ